MTNTLVDQLQALHRRHVERAALLRRHGFSELAGVYARGSDSTERRLRSLPRSAWALAGRQAEPGVDPWTGAALPQRNRMRAVTRLVRTDMSENRAWSRELRGIADRRDGVVADAATAAAGRVSEQTAELNERLRARLTSWASRGDA